MRALTVPQLSRLAATAAHEGPVYVAGEDTLYFTSVPRPGDAGPVVDIRRLDLPTGEVMTVRADANMANGMCLDRGGSLLICEQGGFERPARISRLDLLTGDAETVVDACNGVSLNSPNDVVVRSDGTIWFTDPSYGHLQGFRPPPQTGDHVYRHDPRTGETAVVARGFDKPNGLAFSPDEEVLYVADNGAPHHTSWPSTRPATASVAGASSTRMRLPEGARRCARVPPPAPVPMMMTSSSDMRAPSDESDRVCTRRPSRHGAWGT